MRLAILGAALAAAAPTAAAAQAIPIALAPGEVLLQVKGKGEHLARPDVMGVSAGVVTTGRTAKDALAANARLANRLLDAVRGSGIEPRDVRTSRLSVSPQFARAKGATTDDEDYDDEEASPRRITGYIARNRIDLRLRDLSKAPEIINALFDAGANEVSGPSFSLSDAAPALREARRDAVAEARKEAETYADAVGMKISRVLRVSERTSFEENEQEIIVTGSRIPTSPVEPGELATHVTVWIDYAMVPR